jgi:hypothetical protein
MKIPEVAILALLPAFIVAVWVSALGFVARLGGWSRLAAAYPLRERFQGERKRFASGSLLGGSFFGLPCDYNGSLTLGANPDGLLVAVLPVLRPGHPPLFIPWQDITARVEKGWLATRTVFTFRQVPSVRLRVSLRLARRVIEAAGRSADHHEIFTDD